MRKRRDRTLKELYDVTHRLSEPEITPVLNGSYRIQGPVNELDLDTQVKTGLLPSEKRIGKYYLNENLHMTTRSGTCNLCSAPCSSCMHFKRAVPAMESKIESGFSDNARKEADHSFINTDVPTLYKSRACDNRQHASSEKSNLISDSSIHDSFSENVESKANMRSGTYDASEDVDMPPNVSSCETVGEGQLQTKECNVAAQTITLSSHNHVASDFLQRTFFSRDDEQRGLECHGDNISCVTRVRDANIAVSDLKMVFDRKNISSSASTRGLHAKGLKKVVQVQTIYDEIEESQSNIKRLSSYTKVFSQKKSSSSSSNIGFSPKSPSECLLSNDDPFLKVHSPYSHSQSGPFFHSAGSKDWEQNSSSQPQGEPSECSTEHVESSLVGPLSTRGCNGQKSTALDHADISPNPEGNGNPSDKSIKCQQFGKSSALLAGCDMLGSLTESQPITESENTGADFMEDDIKVCDICGDAGREGLLAICSRCSDGAEHTYCMQRMLDKIPEGDWVCEECKLKEDAENKKVDKSETISGASEGPTCLNERSENFGSTSKPKLLPKLDTKPIDAEETWADKELQSPHPSSKRHTENVEVTSISNKKFPETSVGSAEITSPSRKTVLSRECSFKNLDVGKVKPPNVTPPSGSQYANNSQVIAHLVSPSGPNSSGVQAQPQSPSGLLSKSSSFNSLNSKPRVKELIENVAQKPNLTRESVNGDPKKDGLLRTINKSALFKGMSSRCSNINDKTTKIQSLNPYRAEETRNLKQGKERNVMERKNSFILDRPLVNSLPIGATSLSLPMMDPKAVRHDGKLNNLVESSTRNATRESEDACAPVGFNEVKKQPTISSRIPLSNGVCNLEDQKSSQVVTREDTRTCSSANDKLRHPDMVLQCDLSQSLQSSIRDEKNEATSFSKSRLTISTGNKILRCKKCNETGHTTQFCSIDKLRLSVLKPFTNLREATNKGNKWKDAVEAATSRNTLGKNNRLLDKSEGLTLSSTDLSCVIASKDQESIISSCVRIVTSLEVAPEKQENLKGSTACPSKTTAAIDVKEKFVCPMETVCASRDSALNSLAGASRVKPLMQILPDRAYELPNSLRISAIPELDYIWKGGFEVQRAGQLPELCDGVQAHLSTFASPKVLEVVTRFPGKVILEEVPRLSSWPLQFQENCPAQENVALFFFAKDVESYEKSYEKLLENLLKNDLALKGNLDGIELLIFPSNRLPEKSQRWNRLFFLWGVLRGKKSVCSEPLSSLQKKLSGPSLNVEHLAQDLPTQLMIEPSAAQKVSSVVNTDNELSGCDRSIKTEPVKYFTRVDSPHLSSFESDNWSSHTNEHSLDKKSSYQAAADKVPSEKHASCSFPESCLLTSMSQKNSLPGYCSELGVGTNAAQLCSEVKSDNTCLKGLIDNSGGRNNLDLLPRDTKGGVQNNPSSDKLLPTYSSYRGQGTEGCRDEEKMNDTERFMEGAVSDAWGNMTQEEYCIWELKSNRKRTHSCSPEPVSCASGETSKSPSETILWKDRDCMLLDDEKGHKKMKLFSEVHTSNSSREENLGDRFSSNVHPSLAGFNEQQRDSVCNGKNMPESSTSSESYFFPVDLCSVRDAKSGNFIPLQLLSSDDEDPPESDTPNLELALGAEKKSPTQGTLPLLFPMVDKRSIIDKPPAPALDDGDDVPASLSLSLTFPFSEKERASSISKTEEFLPERPRVNTSLLLFSCFPDT